MQSSEESVHSIVRILGKSPCTISRELNRPQTDSLIKRFLPKRTDFDTISDEKFAYVEDWINYRPMKILNYITHKQKLQNFGVTIAS